MFGKKNKKEDVVVEKPQLPDYSSVIRVLIIDDEADNITDALGISQERVEELHKHFEAVKGLPTITGLFESYNGIVKHANELAFVCYLIGERSGEAKVIKQLVDKIKG